MGYSSLSPIILIFFLFMLLPIIIAFLYSFTSYSLYSEPMFIGFENYFNIFTDEAFWQSLNRSLILVVIVVGLQYLCGIVLALLINENLKGMRWVKYILMIPWVIPVASTVMMFNWLLAPDYGLLNIIFTNFGFEHLNRYWFGDVKWSFFFVILMHIWRNTPFYAITFYAAMKNIPSELFEAAEIDGANSFQKFLNITMPALKYPSMIMISIHVFWTLNNFDFIWLSTGGGPVNATEVLATFTYEKAWTFYEFGEACASGIIMMAIMSIFAIIYIKIVGSEK